MYKVRRSHEISPEKARELGIVLKNHMGRSGLAPKQIAPLIQVHARVRINRDDVTEFVNGNLPTKAYPFYLYCLYERLISVSFLETETTKLAHACYYHMTLSDAYNWRQAATYARKYTLNSSPPVTLVITAAQIQIETPRIAPSTEHISFLSLSRDGRVIGHAFIVDYLNNHAALMYRCPHNQRLEHHYAIISKEAGTIAFLPSMSIRMSSKFDILSNIPYTADMCSEDERIAAATRSLYEAIVSVPVAQRPRDPSLDEKLYWATVDGDAALVQRCIRAGANVNYQEPATKMTALYNACLEGRMDIIEMLMRTKKCNLAIRCFPGGGYFLEGTPQYLVIPQELYPQFVRLAQKYYPKSHPFQPSRQRVFGIF